MKKLVLVSFALMLAVNVQAQFWGNKKIKGNGEMTSIIRTTSDYDGIKCAGSFNFILVSGTEGNIKIAGESNLLEYIITEVKNNNLIVKVDNNVSLQSSRNKTITITIPFRDISEVSLAGSGDLWSESDIKSDDLKVSLAGSGDVKLTIDAQNTTAKVAGSGDLTLTGNTIDLEVDVAGSGDFYGFDLNANNTNVSVAGSGDARVVCNENLVARVAGSGGIRYKGNPTKEDTKVAGSGSISN